MLFIFAVLVLFTIYAFFMRKRLTRIELYATCLFALLLGNTTDAILNIKYDFYGFIGRGYQYSGVLGQFLIYPSINAIFLNYFPYNKKVLKKALYIIGWSIFAL